MLIVHVPRFVPIDRRLLEYKERARNISANVNMLAELLLTVIRKPEKIDSPSRGKSALCYAYMQIRIKEGKISRETSQVSPLLVPSRLYLKVLEIASRFQTPRVQSMCLCVFSSFPFSLVFSIDPFFSGLVIARYLAKFVCSPMRCRLTPSISIKAPSHFVRSRMRGARKNSDPNPWRWWMLHVSSRARARVGEGEVTIPPGWGDC